MTGRRLLAIAAIVWSAHIAAAPLGAQTPGIWWAVDTGSAQALRVMNHEGYAVVPASDLERFGWEVVAHGDSVDLFSDRVEMDSVRLVAGTPFIRWGGEVLQLTHAPYWLDGRHYVPAQLILDFLPRRVPTISYDPLTRTLRSEIAVDVATDAIGYRASDGSEAVGVGGESGLELRNDPAEGDSTAPRSPTPAPVDLTTPRPREERLVVVIDPGHGGRDPGTTGRAGVREKDVALALGLALADELSADSALEVYLTRQSDVLIPIWRRGEQATALKADRHGLFVSIHANALPGSRATRGFETYVLSEARTDHERRVAAIENGDPRPDDVVATGREGSDLDLMLRELQNLGYQTWSVLLAELVQEELAEVHTGRDRGVKQAPLAVITNALMPAVLVETGYLTNGRDEALLRTPEFHQNAARAMAHAIRRFFQRYPPGERSTTSEEH